MIKKIKSQPFHILLAAFGLIGGLVASASLHLHVSYKFGVLGEWWTKRRVQRSKYVAGFLLIGCSIGK